jgi:selenocysteine lyase/cysteine desulfurase
MQSSRLERSLAQLRTIMFGRLTNLTRLTFDGLDPDDEDLERFWGESSSTFLTDLYFINMNLVSCEEMLTTASAPNITSITFQHCTISNEIGNLLHQEDQDELNTTLCFIESSFNNTNTMREIIDFATKLADIGAMVSYIFTYRDSRTIRML